MIKSYNKINKLNLEFRIKPLKETAFINNKKKVKALYLEIKRL